MAVEATTDGFALAEKDLEMRGPGEFLGTQQSGFPELRMATFADTRLLYQVREIAAELLADDPDLDRFGLAEDELPGGILCVVAALSLCSRPSIR